MARKIPAGGICAVNPKTKALFEARARIIKAMAHPTRLFIVHELSQGERCVWELHEKIEADMSTVSKHLAILRSAGIISDEKRGNQVFYTLRVPCVMNFFSCVESVLKTSATDTIDLVG
ncbi:MAG: ArsR family transcriptional regulator [Thiotrichales bacterium SG8_50]|nr:MAG: ArsR family transcriptional regulator [Thiotrichales bacterium SG8_50]